MPNHCNNKLSLIGSTYEVLDFIKKAEGNRVKFKSNLPINIDNDYNEFNFHSLIPLPNEVLDGYYDPKGYEAENSTWGIKWGASYSTLESLKCSKDKAVVTYHYMTPWSNGDTFLNKLGQKFPHLIIINSFEEESPSRGRMLLNHPKAFSLYEDTQNTKRFSQMKYYNSHEKFVKSLIKSK